MFRLLVLSAMFAFFPRPASAGTLLDTIHGTGARNGIIVLVQAEDAVCEDAEESGFVVLALETRPEQVEGWGGTISRLIIAHHTLVRR